MKTNSVLVETAAEATEIFMSDIDQLDFTLVKRKLQDTEEGLGWRRALCNEAEREYKRFLALKRTYPEKDIVPNKIVDAFWHQHILDTEKYARDCEEIFGYFVHHYPYFGMNGKKDAQNLTNAFEESVELYQRHFSESYVSQATRCKAPKCRTQCKPMKCK
jgi:hypothetical protein